MRYLICTEDVDPCPPGNVASVPFLETVDFAAMGITPEKLEAVFLWGFSAVITFFVVGLVLGAVIAVINKA